MHQEFAFFKLNNTVIWPGEWSDQRWWVCGWFQGSVSQRKHWMTNNSLNEESWGEPVWVQAQTTGVLKSAAMARQHAVLMFILCSDKKHKTWLTWRSGGEIFTILSNLSKPGNTVSCSRLPTSLAIVVLLGRYWQNYPDSTFDFIPDESEQFRRCQIGSAHLSHCQKIWQCETRFLPWLSGEPN